MEKKQIFEKTSHNDEKLKEGILWGFSTLIQSQNIKKLKKEKYLFSEQKSHCAEKTESGTPWDFPTSTLTQNSKQIEAQLPLWGKIVSEKVSQCRKNFKKGDPLVSPGMVCYAEKQEKPFWFSSLRQMGQIGEIIFCRTFKNYFAQFVCIEKKNHHNSRVSLHEAPTKKHLSPVLSCSVLKPVASIFCSTMYFCDLNRKGEISNFSIFCDR